MPEREMRKRVIKGGEDIATSMKKTRRGGSYGTVEWQIR